MYHGCCCVVSSASSTRALLTLTFVDARVSWHTSRMGSHLFQVLHGCGVHGRLVAVFSDIHLICGRSSRRREVWAEFPSLPGDYRCIPCPPAVRVFHPRSATYSRTELRYAGSATEQIEITPRAHGLSTNVVSHDDVAPVVLYTGYTPEAPWRFLRCYPSVRPRTVCFPPYPTSVHSPSKSRGAYRGALRLSTAASGPGCHQIYQASNMHLRQ